MKSPMRFGVRAFCVIACTMGCEETTVECLLPPCAMPVAITLSVTSGTPAVPVAGAFVLPAGYTAPIACTDATAICYVAGTAGTYELDVGAPGYQTVHKTFVVSGTTPTCGCPSVNTQQQSVSLLRSAS